jgi:hypothetical protein
MTKPADIKKTPTGRLQLASIVRKTARAVGYCLTYAVAVAGLVACQDWHRAHAINCNAPGVVCDF